LTRNSRKTEIAALQKTPQKERILSAASDVFLAVGFEKTSTADIARLAKVSKRELYLHFSDKCALLAAVVEDLQSDMQGRMDSLWASGDAMEDVLLNSAKVIQRFILSERFGKLVRIVAAESYHSPNIAKQFFESGPNQGRRATARYLKEQMKQGHLRTADPQKAADDFLDLVVGAQLMTAVILGQIDPATPKPADTRHAVKVFLMIYGNDVPKRTLNTRARSAR
jgi:TetR/AcrR family transcriptional repressor of mexJK operon